MVVAGLTGNYGMGKSFVLSEFRKLGAYTLESDKIVGELLKEPRVKKKIKRLFGPESITRKGVVDKKYIAKIIFNNKRLKKQVEAILHPLVFEKVNASTKSMSKKKKCVVVVEVPLLFEGNYRSRFDRVITVYSTKKTALGRLVRTGISRTEAFSRMKAQWPIYKKRKFSDYRIDNNGSRANTRRQVERIYRALVAESTGKT